MFSREERKRSRVTFSESSEFSNGKGCKDSIVVSPVFGIIPRIGTTKVPINILAFVLV